MSSDSIQGATVVPLESFPDHKLHVWIYKDVSNAKELRAQLTANQLPLECALIQAQLVPDISVIAAAAHAALTAASRGALLSRSLHSDLVVNLSGSRHVAESLRRYGAHDSSTAVLVARIDGTEEEVASLGGLVQGVQVAPGDLPALADSAAIMKLLKIPPEEVAAGGLPGAVLTRMAARDCL